MQHLHDAISISEIERQAYYSLHPFLEPDHLSPQLFRSIQNVGILTPPIIIPQRKNGYKIVCGRQRLACCELLGGSSECMCKILPESITPEDILTIIIEDQAACGELTIVEQAAFLALCDTLLPDKNTREAFLARVPNNLLGKGRNFLRPLSTLSFDIQRKIHIGSLSEKVAAELQKVSPTDQHHFVDLVEQFAIGGNRQKSLLIQLVDISRREGISFSLLLEELGTAEMVQKEITSAQRLKLLLEEVEKRYQPLYWQAKTSFAREIEKLQLPDSCAVHASPSFERNDVTLTIRFDTLRQLQKDLPKVLSITGGGTLK